MTAININYPIRLFSIFCCSLLLSASLGSLAQEKQFHAADGMMTKENNYKSFFKPVKDNDPEIALHNKGYENDPELGMLFAEAPCKDCYELISKRTETSKTFVKKGSNEEQLYMQSSTMAMHYKDAQGKWRTIRSTLDVADARRGLFSADNRELPVTIDAQHGFVSVGKEQTQMVYNNDLELIYVAPDGTEQSLGKANWKNFSAGDDGIYVTNAWEGVDIEITLKRLGVKTNFYINHAMPQYAAGILLLRDHMQMNDMALQASSGKKNFIGNIDIKSKSGEKNYFLSQAVAYEKENNRKTYQPLEYTLNGNDLDIIMPGNFFNRAASSYPIIVDPLLLSTSTNVNVVGFTYSAGCNIGCAVVNPATVPAAVTITDVQWSFTYTSTTNMNAAAIDFNIGACRSPVGVANCAANFWTCGLLSPGTCTGTNISIFPDISSCLPAPQCASYNLNITMHAYEIQTNVGTCTSTPPAAVASPLIITVIGHTVELNTIGNGSTICQGQSANLTAAGHYGVPPYTYTWNPGAVNGSPASVSPTATTVYALTITDQCGNTATGNETITVIPNNNPGFTINPNPACAGGTVTVTGLGAAAAASYDWVATGSANPTVNNTQTWTTSYATNGTYNITLNFANGNCIFPSTLPITVGQPPAATPTTNAPVCSGDPLDLFGNTVAGATYSWTGPTTYTSAVQNPVISPAAVSNSGVYTLTITVPGCTPSTGTVNVSVIPHDTANFTYVIHYGCTQDTVVFTNTSTNATSYTWDFGDGGTSAQQDPTHIYTTQGNYNVKLTVNNGVCSDNITIGVNTLHPLVAAFTTDRDTLCKGQTVTFTDASTGTGLTTLWDFGDGNTDNSYNTQHSYTAAGTYTVTLTATDFVPCHATATLLIYVPDFKVTVLHDTSVCLQDSMLLTATVSAPSFFTGYSYTWSPASTFGEPYQASTFFDSPLDADYNFTCTVTAFPFGCTSSDAGVIHNHAHVNLRVLTPDQTINYGSSLRLEVRGGYYYVWTPVNVIDNPNQEDPVVTPEEPTVFHVIAYSEYGCWDTANIHIGIHYPDPSVPSVFSPNGDGKNDVFRLLNTKYMQLQEFRVFNRWGEEVFNTLDPQIGWDGTYNGHPCDIGTYHYVIRLGQPDGTDNTILGDITLIR
ncbi:MAG: PKD domain-containing protein [Bacteroidota bacterium]